MQTYIISQMSKQNRNWWVCPEEMVQLCKQWQCVVTDKPQQVGGGADVQGGQTVVWRVHARLLGADELQFHVRGTLPWGHGTWEWCSKHGARGWSMHPSAQTRLITAICTAIQKTTSPT